MDPNGSCVLSAPPSPRRWGAVLFSTATGFLGPTSNCSNGGYFITACVRMLCGKVYSRSYVFDPRSRVIQLRLGRHLPERVGVSLFPENRVDISRKRTNSHYNRSPPPLTLPFTEILPPRTSELCLTLRNSHFPITLTPQRFHTVCTRSRRPLSPEISSPRYVPGPLAFTSPPPCSLLLFG